MGVATVVDNHGGTAVRQLCILAYPATLLPEHCHVLWKSSANCKKRYLENPYSQGFLGVLILNLEEIFRSHPPGDVHRREGGGGDGEGEVFPI